MPPEETVAKSPLDKPLNQVTEDDISQLTREDCRRYLKQKGMRRPSWNKSQAIQQVISLKTLLETTSNSGAAGARKKLYIPSLRYDNVNNNNNVKNDNPMNSASKGTSADEEISESAEETLPKDAEKPDVSGSIIVADIGSSPRRNTGSSNMPVGQMTIFYCGRVNVFDDVPSDKAQALMHLAASPLAWPQEVLSDCSLAGQSKCHLQDTNVKACPDSSVLLLPNMQPVKMTESIQLHGEECKLSEDNSEAPASRKASVQRYLEKRKDRFKSKRKVGMTSSSGLDIYLNHQMGHHISNEHPSRSDPCFRGQIILPNTPLRCSSMEANFSSCKDTDVKK